jgi:hypothetical protein
MAAVLTAHSAPARSYRHRPVTATGPRETTWKAEPIPPTARHHRSLDNADSADTAGQKAENQKQARADREFQHGPPADPIGCGWPRQNPA